jgi:hypothetical protein
VSLRFQLSQQSGESYTGLIHVTAAYTGLIPTNERYGRVTLLRTDTHGRGILISSAILD